MYLTDLVIDPTNPNPPPPGQAAKCQAKQYRVGLAVTNAQASVGSIAPPSSFAGIVGPGVIQEIANAQARLNKTSAFLGKGATVRGTPVSTGPGVQVVSSMNVNASLLPVLCPARFRSRAQGAPMWGDAASTLCSQYPGGWSGFVGSHPWISLFLAVAGGGALVALSKKRR